MSKKNRPLSPHLQIYRLQWTMLLSISHRITGVALALGSMLLIYWLAAAASGPDAFKTAQSVIASLPGRLLLFGWSFALFYHLCNGIRHLFWDAGYGYELATAYRSGLTVLVVSLVLTLGAWAAGYGLLPLGN
ncbi:succinate dehydrogenase, cytochrome b556 subunit [Denitrobaculum tricleocarpae]|uniref:Succinate dehydrogenase cytochrome b556 subunit n=1 Tax=Denitrobaculum tricleocarpae TaxID=2591009 RepID=A0A545TXV5_9PROT|nr:succinate dehydrogenase, cytochrome b556 subunit [Denitrobaculum tricleocarpae]TQV82053.1 succinate dehydrogenase, cytochrome b556 subunit [Denitrobaculum tricleocarpae]